MAGKRRRYGADFKAKVALEALRGEVGQPVQGELLGVRQDGQALALVRHRFVIPRRANFPYNKRCTERWECRHEQVRGFQAP
jgi:hypothetical protein